VCLSLQSLPCAVASMESEYEGGQGQPDTVGSGRAPSGLGQVHGVEQASDSSAERLATVERSVRRCLELLLSVETVVGGAAVRVDVAADGQGGGEAVDGTDAKACMGRMGEMGVAAAREVDECARQVRAGCAACGRARLVLVVGAPSLLALLPRPPHTAPRNAPHRNALDSVRAARLVRGF
jgi:hypothetical protein